MAGTPATTVTVSDWFFTTQAWVLVMGVDSGGDIYASSFTELLLQRERCWQHADEILIDTPRFYLAQGNFAACL